MNSDLIVITIMAFLSFILPALIYNYKVGRSSRFSNEISTFFPLCIAVAPLSVAAYFIFYDSHDFLRVFWLPEIVALFVAAIALFLSIRNNRLFYLFTIIGAIAGSWLLPYATAVAIFPFSAICNRLIVALLWCLFTYIYKYSDTGDGMTAIQSLTISLGIAVLGLINAIPVLLGVLGLIFSAAFSALLLFTWPPARLRINDKEASCLGFMLFGLMVWTAGENAGSCVIIYSMYILADFVWALMLRLTFLEKYSNIMQNTSYRQSLSIGFSPSSAATFACRGQILLLFFGTFQALSSTQGSLLLISAFIAVWILYKLRNLSESLKIRDINRQVVDDLQARVNEVKQYLHRDDNF